jgi:hypothetical protein
LSATRMLSTLRSCGCLARDRAREDVPIPRPADRSGRALADSHAVLLARPLGRGGGGERVGRRLVGDVPGLRAEGGSDEEEPNKRGHGASRAACTTAARGGSRSAWSTWSSVARASSRRAGRAALHGPPLDRRQDHPVLQVRPPDHPLPPDRRAALLGANPRGRGRNFQWPCTREEKPGTSASATKTR